MEYNCDFYGILSLFALGIGCFFLFYLSIHKKYYTWPNGILSLLLLFIGFELWNDVLVHSRLIYAFPWFFKLQGKFRLAWVSLMSIYLLLISSKTKRPKMLYGLIALLFCIDVLIWLPQFVGLSIADKQEMIVQFYADTRPGPTNTWRIPRFIIFRLIVPVILLIFSSHRLYLFTKRKDIKRLKSYKLLGWLAVAMMVYILLEDLILQAIYKHTGLSFIEWTVDLLLMSFLLVLIAFFVMKQLEFSQADVEEREVLKYRRSKLGAVQLAEILDQIKIKIEQEKLYLDPDMSQMKLSQLTATNSSYLSQAINVGMDMRFTDFLNQYRVDAAKRLLESEAADRFTIEAIGQQVGFRSKSAFYRAFKKEMGISPLTYKKRISSDL